MSFANLKKASSLDKLTKALAQTSTKKGFERDERYWQPEVDKAGNGYAIIRFLQEAQVDGEDALPWVLLWTHGFQGPNGWYIENSLTTLGQKDPVSVYNSQLWDTGIESNKTKARDQKRKLNYISNILVVKDPAHPENEGKVFLYSYGKKIHDKIRQKIDPTEEEVSAAALEGITLEKEPVLDFWKGKNFKLKIRKVEGYRNYDKSEFDGEETPVGKNDKEIEAIYNKAHSLKAEVAPNKFKAYADLEARLNKVLGLDGAPPASKSTVKSTPVDDDQGTPFDADPPKEEKQAAKKAAPKKEAPKSDEGDDDAMLNMFKNLADQD